MSGTLDNCEGVRRNVNVIRGGRPRTLLADRPTLRKTIGHDRLRTSRLDYLTPNSGERLVTQEKCHVLKRYSQFLHRQAHVNGVTRRSIHARPEPVLRHADEVLTDLMGIARRDELGFGQSSSPPHQGV